MSAEFCNRKNRSLRVLIIAKDNLDDLTNHPGLIQCAINIEDGDGLDELSHWDFVLSNIVLVDEQAGRATVNECRSMPFDTRIGGFELDVDCEGVIAGGGRDFKFAREPSFPGWATKVF